MSKELVISANRHETRVALLEDDQLVEVYFQRANEYSLAGSIHKGRVTRVLPGMQSAFVDLGLERDTFLYVSDFLEEHEDFDQVTGDERPPRERDRERDRERRPPQPPPLPASLAIAEPVLAPAVEAAAPPRIARVNGPTRGKATVPETTAGDDAPAAAAIEAGDSRIPNTHRRVRKAPPSPSEPQRPNLRPNPSPNTVSSHR